MEPRDLDLSISDSDALISQFTGHTLLPSLEAMKYLFRIKTQGINTSRLGNPLDLDVVNHRDLRRCVAHVTIARADKGWRNSGPF
jgi:hypothetical protein